MQRYISAIVFTWIFGFCIEVLARAPIPLEIGSTYKVVGELYAHVVTTDLNTRKAEYFVIVPIRLAGPEIVSRQIVPIGSQVRILAKEATKWPSLLYSEKYIVEVSSLAKKENLPVVLGLSRGNEGDSVPLNPLIYEKIN